MKRLLSFLVIALFVGISDAQTTISGVYTIQVSASDVTPFNRDCGVAFVQIFLNGNQLAKLTTPTSGTIYQYDWNTVGVPNGTYTITASMTDKANNKATTLVCDGTNPNTSAITSGSTRTIIVSNPDTTAPTVTITQPIANSTVSGKVQVAITAADDGGLKQVDLYANSTLIASSTSGANTLTYSWNTNPYKGRLVTLSAKATDNSGNVSSVSSIQVQVKR